MHQASPVLLCTPAPTRHFDEDNNSSAVPAPTRNVFVEKIEYSPAPQVVRQTASVNELVVVEKLRPITVHELPSLKPCQLHVFRNLHRLENVLNISSGMSM